MSTNHTANYNLSQWEKADKVLMEDFNADNAKIDGALAGKAEQSALDALAQTVTGHSAALNAKGNCRIYFSSYTGTGTFGSGSRTYHSFPGRPLFAAVGEANGQHMLTALQGMAYGCLFRGSEVGSIPVSWGGNSLGWYSSSALLQLNMANTRYYVMALVAVDE